MSTKKTTATETDERQQTDDTLEDRNVRVVLEVERGGPCVMDDIDGDILDTEVRFEDGQCRADIDVRTRGEDEIETNTKQFVSDICSHCPRDIFSKYGCIPRYLEVKPGSFVVETYLAETTSISAFIGELGERCETVTLRSLTRTDQSAYTDSCSIDLSRLTPKQREAVYRATELGYYDPDSAVGLSDIADDLGVSPSAVSQRLSRATANVLRQLDCGCDC